MTDTLYVTATEYHAWAHNRPGEDLKDDDEIGIICAAVTAGIDDYCGFPYRRFVQDPAPTQQAPLAARIYAADHDCLVRITDVGDITGLVVKIDFDGDGTYETTMGAGTFDVEPHNAIADGLPVTALRANGLGYLFPIWGHRPLVQVTARWGWKTIPSAVRAAARIQAGRLWARRDSPFGFMQTPDFPNVPIRARLDPDVEVMLKDVRRKTAAGVAI